MRAGKCWKALPRDERKVWEAKAIAALAEHRKKYPDWRFKPAANALAKVKDGPRKRSARKGRGQSEKEERSREKRCAKIADFIVAGKTGPDLAAAVQQYDCEVEVERGRRPKECANAGAGIGEGTEGEDMKGHAVRAAQVQAAVAEAAVAGQPQPQLLFKQEREDGKHRAAGGGEDARFEVPLTAMFKRSSSAPAPRALVASGAGRGERSDRPQPTEVR